MAVTTLSSSTFWAVVKGWVKLLIYLSLSFFFFWCSDFEISIAVLQTDAQLRNINMDCKSPLSVSSSSLLHNVIPISTMPAQIRICKDVFLEIVCIASTPLLVLISSNIMWSFSSQFTVFPLLPLKRSQLQAAAIKWHTSNTRKQTVESKEIHGKTTNWVRAARVVWEVMTKD